MVKTKIKNMAKKGINHPILSEIYKIGMVVLGGLLVAFGLEAFLIPHGFLDGGVTGVSIILSNLSGLPMGLFLAMLNLPFILLAWWKIGRRSAVRTSIGIATLSLSTIAMHHMDSLTDEFFVALLLGGSLLGLGVGLALRQGGALDGTEALASIISNKSPLAVDQIILLVNVAIFTVAGFVVGIESALASAVLFFFAVSPMIKRVVDGNSEVKTTRVITDNPEMIAEEIQKIINRRITSDKRFVFDKDKGFDKEVYELIFTVVRLEESEVTDVIIKNDPNAVVIFSEVSSLRGGIYENMKSEH